MKMIANKEFPWICIFFNSQTNSKKSDFFYLQIDDPEEVIANFFLVYCKSHVFIDLMIEFCVYLITSVCTAQLQYLSLGNTATNNPLVHLGVSNRSRLITSRFSLKKYWLKISGFYDTNNNANQSQ